MTSAKGIHYGTIASGLDDVYLTLLIYYLLFLTIKPFEKRKHVSRSFVRLFFLLASVSADAFHWLRFMCRLTVANILLHRKCFA